MVRFLILFKTLKQKKILPSQMMLTDDEGERGKNTMGLSISL